MLQSSELIQMEEFKVPRLGSSSRSSNSSNSEGGIYYLACLTPELVYRVPPNFPLHCDVQEEVMAVAKTLLSPSVHPSLVLVGSAASHRPHPWQNRARGRGEGAAEREECVRGKAGEREGGGGREGGERKRRKWK